METQFIAQRGVTQQHFDLARTGGLIDIVGRFPAQYMLGTLGQHGLVAHLLEVVCHLVGVEQFGIPYRRSLESEDIFDEVGLEGELLFELLLVVLRGDRIAVRGSQELDTLGGCQFFEYIDHFRCELLEHLERHARHCDGAMELAFRQLDHVAQGVTQRHIGGVHQPLEVFLGLHVVLTNIKETIAFQTVRSMHLKAKTYIFHKS